MSDLFPVAGSHIYIGPAMTVPTSDVTSSTFTSVTWTEIDGWSTMGTIGDKAAMITTSLINRNRDVSQKGTRQAPSMANKFAVNTTDPGQLALIAGEASNLNYPFKIVFNDAPAGGTPTIKYFIGLVTDASEDGGAANTVRLMNGAIQVNTNTVTVPASA